MKSPTSASSTYACLEGCIILNEYRRELSVENNQDTLFPRGIVAIVPTRSIYARKNAGRKLGWIAEREKETARCFSLLVVRAKILSVLPQAPRPTVTCYHKTSCCTPPCASLGPTVHSYTLDRHLEVFPILLFPHLCSILTSPK